MNIATIDIGTNTTLLLVVGTLTGSQTPRDGIRRAEPVGSHAIARTAPDVEVLEDRAEITRLGRGIGHSGALQAEAIERTLAVLREYASIARRHGAPVAAIGTEALRRAPNAAAFLEPAAAILGAPVEVIDGAREAALTFQAALRSFPDEAARGPLVVIDIGGGSTEIVVAQGGTVAGALAYRTSLPLGSVRLTERHIHHDPPLAGEVDAVNGAVASALAEVPFPASGATLIGVAGTVTSLAAMAQRLGSYDPTRVHGFVLSRQALEAEVARLCASTQAERERIVGLDPKRADVILAGALILLRIADAARADGLVVSDRGIRWGLLYEILERGAG